MDCVWDDVRMSLDNEVASEIPKDVADNLRDGSSLEYLNGFASLALNSKWTRSIYSTHEPLFADFCSRWFSAIDTRFDPLSIALAITRVLPFAPTLSNYLEELICRQRSGVFQLLFSYDTTVLSDLPHHELVGLLIIINRLLDFDNHLFGIIVRPSKIQVLLGHPQKCVRYLAIRIICSFLHAADAVFQRMVEKYIGEGRIEGQWEDKIIDYRFFALWEKEAIADLRKTISAAESGQNPGQIICENSPCRVIREVDLNPGTVCFGGVLVYRAGKNPQRESSLAMTRATRYNLRQIAHAINGTRPILVSGLTGAGKTSIIRDLARSLHEDSTLITLHLNEQTDAKVLIGMYTSGTTAGSFHWRPGVLTTAVTEGRWVLIEDLDRAPTSVISILLPLLHRRELYVPNLGGCIKASQNFRLFATIRSTLDLRSDEVVPGSNMLGIHKWNHVHLHIQSREDLRNIMSRRFPVLRAYQTRILHLYDRLELSLPNCRSTFELHQSARRSYGLQDLMRYCSRIQCLMIEFGVALEGQAIPEAVNDSIFMEAIDCFAGFLQKNNAARDVVSMIAQELEFSAERAAYCVHARIPELSSSGSEIRLGRVTLAKSQDISFLKSPMVRGTQRPFARTNQALRYLETISMAVRMNEPCLLVGETGTGKTAMVQELAGCLGRKLVVVNLSQQSEAGDLLGGFKPVNLRAIAMPIQDEFDDLFESTFSTQKNQRFVNSLGKTVAKGKWARTLTLWQEALKMVEAAFRLAEQRANSHEQQPKKRRKVESLKFQKLKARWDHFACQVDAFQQNLTKGSKGFNFAFVEGNLFKAVKNGDWVLLDEINLASPDTLEQLADLLADGIDMRPSILLTESGDVERIYAHPDFRIFGAMNPATDVGKRDLPISLRTRFTEYYIQAPDGDLDSLKQVINAYLGNYIHSDGGVSEDVATLYLDIKALESQNQLVDGAEQRPHFSLRTLTRTLTYVTDISPVYGLRRALFEGFSMSFLTVLNKESELMVLSLIDKHLLGSQKNRRALLNQTPRRPNDHQNHIQFRHYWIRRGHFPVEEQPHYIITPFVESNLLNLVRATSTRRFPVLLQGPTSSGKTSMVEYLAKISGNIFVRINNHEHTDLQEYIGTYVSAPDGQLQYQEGILVRALREGHWVVLDELNLAPSDILEALNRLLDDNRELLIPETQEVVRPHENFMLFATQNPPGMYGGRKVLSRAFRNRFLELHFDDIPEDELEIILRERSQIAPSFCTRIVTVYKKLAILRQSGRLFEQRNSFATLRDLFRWALRDATDREELARNGFMLLAERVRNPDERLVVKEVIEEVMKVQIVDARIYEVDVPRAAESSHIQSSNYLEQIVWTQSMKRLYVLVTQALKNREPVLLVGDTGCGKTTICQVIAEIMHTPLHIVNAHQNTETGDLIGAQRPVRNQSDVEVQLLEDLLTAFKEHCPQLLSEERTQDKSSLLKLYNETSDDLIQRIPYSLRKRIDQGMSRLNALFEWSDGSLVQAMKSGHHFLLDEISLADDSVLERLNSVLEPGRAILLAEKGGEEALVIASENFQFLATMNPGGDYGKKELSPALRNRFTEIWVPPLSDIDDVLEVAQAKILPELIQFAKPMVDFSVWFAATYGENGASSSIRDILAWVEFVDNFQKHNPYFAILHGAAMVYIDALGANPATKLSIAQESVMQERDQCLAKLSTLFKQDMSSLYYETPTIDLNEGSLTLGPFELEILREAPPQKDFTLLAPTTIKNAIRLARALQLKKPVLIEGSPGVGKTTLVAALAQTIGMPLSRINLSEQTDIIDLFGSDVPVEDETAIRFAWRDAPFLQAMKRGEWVLLDEMNLASQSVLEGLNACLDHRGQIYVPELNRTFSRHPRFAIFAAQNPHHQGGGRKGLPASFVNRFSVVYADVFTPTDLLTICNQLYPNLEQRDIKHSVEFVTDLSQLTQSVSNMFMNGSPWEFNLRDVLKWLSLLNSSEALMPLGMLTDYQNVLFNQRFRSLADALAVSRTLRTSAPVNDLKRSYFRNISVSSYQCGLGLLERKKTSPIAYYEMNANNIEVLESMMLCVTQRWPVLLVGSPESGKQLLLRHLASLVGADIAELPLNADIDTMDIIGGYDQADIQRDILLFKADLRKTLEERVTQEMLLPTDPSSVTLLLEGLEQIATLDLQKTHHLLTHLQNITSIPEFATLAIECERLINLVLQESRPRFEWVDGTLIRALQKGQWLILEDANLCSSSVLDRLNSLLEPNGVLNVNEHCLPDGTSKVIRPHEDFRLFLTMDPRHGELSRSMRNRCVEIYVKKSPEKVHPEFTPSFYDSSLSRFNYFQNFEWSSMDDASLQALATVCCDHLTFSDLPLLGFWYGEVVTGLMDVQPHKMQLLSMVIRTNMHILQQKSGILLQIWKLYQRICSKLRLKGDFCNVQTIHPLNNPILLGPHNPNSSYHEATRLATLWEATNELGMLSSETAAIEHGLNHRAPLQMSKLERSMASNDVFAFSKDSTKPIAAFLSGCERDLSKWIEQYNLDYDRDEIQHEAAIHSPSTCDWHAVSMSVKNILHFVRDILDYVHSPEFDEGIFQTYIGIGRSLATNILEHEATYNLGRIMGEHLEVFNASWKLSTGTSMEIMWNHFREPTARDVQHLGAILEVEKLAHDFDTLVTRSKAPFAVLSDLRDDIGRIYSHVRSTDYSAVNQLKAIKQALANIELTDSVSDMLGNHYFQELFERVCQYYCSYDFMREAKTLSACEIAAGRSTKDSATLASAPIPNDLLKSIRGSTGILSQATNLTIVRNDLSISIVDKLRAMSEVPLGSLDLLCRDITLLASSVADATQQIARSPLDSLSTRLVQLHLEVYKSHHAYLEPKSIESFENFVSDLCFGSSKIPQLPQISVSIRTPDSHVSSMLRRITEKYFGPSLREVLRIVSAESIDISSIALAWIHFFSGCLLLYVPDKPSDPALKPTLELDRFRKRAQELRTKLTALETYEEQFTGQSTTVRSELVKQALHSLGPEPDVLRIARPVVSELPQLQGEFTNILNAVVRGGHDGSTLQMQLEEDNGEMQELNHIKQNISHSIRRLSENFRAYDDITKIITSLLEGLDVGLALALIASDRDRPVERYFETICRLTPFVTFEPIGLIQSILDDNPVGRDVAIDLRLAQVRLLSLDKNITGHLHLSARRIVNETFQSIYDDWKNDLAARQEMLTAKSSMYRHRGGEDKAEESDDVEFHRLFPEFEIEGSVASPKANVSANAQGLARRIADCHYRLFKVPLNPSVQILEMVRETVQQISIKKESGRTISIFPIGAEKMLPAVVLMLSESSERLLSPIEAQGRYNFYRDPNLVEVRRVIVVTRRVQHRFREITEQWPEHATLSDVLRTAGELLSLRHTDPLAKIITKCEQLYSYVHEWQIVASREFAVVDVYSELTNLLVSWRRLELSTWAQLLDMEDQKCYDNAKDWWFVAYEIIIAASLPVSSSELGLQAHVNELVAVLGDFMQTTSMGQYSHCLRLVEAFREHVVILTEDLPAMALVGNALANVLGLFTRFEPVVQDALGKGRRSLEKDLKEILLLASWKDTNILALKESAKRSHHKLFKVIRKYRGLLGQSAKCVMEQELPEQVSAMTRSGQLESHFIVNEIDPTAIRVCQDSIQNWRIRTGRFMDSRKTTYTMIQMSRYPTEAVDCPSYLESFCSNLLDAIKDLQQETPATLTDENKSIMKNLKFRKRKVFADTLKELRLMGFQSNVSEDIRIKQQSTSIVLATTPSLRNSLFDDHMRNIELDFHIVLTNMPLIRDGARQHSDDLGSGDVARSIGFLESMLSVLLRQRTGIAKFLTGADVLDGIVVRMQDLWAPGLYSLHRDESTSSYIDILEQRVKWLPNIISVATTILEKYNKIGSFDCSNVVASLHQQKEIFSSIVVGIEGLPRLPSCVSTSLHSRIYLEAQTALDSFQTELKETSKKYPTIAFVLKQIESWTAIRLEREEKQASDTYSTDTSDIDTQLSTILDAVRVSLQYVHESLAAIPRSSTDSGWLIRADTMLLKAVKSFYVHHITGLLRDVLASLSCLATNDPQDLCAAAALCAVALPILQQYRQIYHTAIRRYLKLHCSLCRMIRVLTGSFKQIVSDGFCSPSEKAGTEESTKERLDEGTGLGEGEGAKDISKDLQIDEDLSELAQEGHKEKDAESIEDQEDAVDMHNDDLEGEIGDDVENEDEEDGDARSDFDKDEIDDETGDVDDLDPSAVDEKLWNGKGDEAHKDKEGEDSMGTKENEMVAQDSINDKEDDHMGDNDDAEDPTAEESEEVAQTETEKIDTHLQEQSNLDLPEEMNIDGDTNHAKDSDYDSSEELSDGDVDESETDELVTAEEGDRDIGEHPDLSQSEQMELADKDADGEKTEDAEPDQDDANDDSGLLRDRNEDTATDFDHVAPSDNLGLGYDNQKEDQVRKQEHSNKNSHGDGREATPVSESGSPAEVGELRQLTARNQITQGAEQSLHDTRETQAFRRLGDALEKWHRQNRQIKSAPKADAQESVRSVDMNGSNEDFEHLPNEDAQADTQALGAATEDQAQALDQRAFESEIQDQSQQPVQVEVDYSNGHDSEQIASKAGQRMTVDNPREDLRSGAIVGVASKEEDLYQQHNPINGKSEDDIADLDNDLSIVHLEGENEAAPHFAEEARCTWSHYENLTRDLSLSLTEQLRLVLAPTLATRLRGDFRTGKRLNIKRIIPYIASQYKRDKIWMRRSVPSKRNYQIMLAVDDSRSMGESGSGQLAFETLALVSKSLSMLEVGQICIVGFGDEVHVAHEFDKPFSSEAGVRVLQQFRFEQSRTNVKSLIAQSIRLFRDARSKTSNAGTDLWQLELIISDGVCEDHESIRRLVRQAQEERIMIVFVIVDALKGESIMDMTQATFEADAAGDTKLKIRRYLDGFPFGYYLIVGDVRELPTVLATALRQWFAEVAALG